MKLLAEAQLCRSLKMSTRRQIQNFRLPVSMLCLVAGKMLYVHSYTQGWIETCIKEVELEYGQNDRYVGARLASQ